MNNLGQRNAIRNVEFIHSDTPQNMRERNHNLLQPITGSILSPVPSTGKGDNPRVQTVGQIPDAPVLALPPLDIINTQALSVKRSQSSCNYINFGPPSLNTCTVGYSANVTGSRLSDIGSGGQFQRVVRTSPQFSTYGDASHELSSYSSQGSAEDLETLAKGDDTVSVARRNFAELLRVKAASPYIHSTSPYSTSHTTSHSTSPHSTSRFSIHGYPIIQSQSHPSLHPSSLPHSHSNLAAHTSTNSFSQHFKSLSLPDCESYGNSFSGLGMTNNNSNSGISNSRSTHASGKPFRKNDDVHIHVMTGIPEITAESDRDRRARNLKRLKSSNAKIKRMSCLLSVDRKNRKRNIGSSCLMDDLVDRFDTSTILSPAVTAKISSSSNRKCMGRKSIEENCLENRMVRNH